MDESEARALLTELMADATRPEFTYRHQWRPGDVIMWDNRATMRGSCISRLSMNFSGAYVPGRRSARPSASTTEMVVRTIDRA